MPSVIEILDRIQKENSGKVKFYYFDAKENPATQQEAIDKLLKRRSGSFTSSTYTI